MIFLFFIFFQLWKVGFAVGNENDTLWNYDPTGDLGPEHWGDYFPSCANQSSGSPIEIIPSSVIKTSYDTGIL